MSVSFYARRARLKREARGVLKGHPEFSEMLRSELFTFAKEKGYKLSSALNDAACVAELEKQFSDDMSGTLYAMNEERLRFFAKKYELAVGKDLSFKDLQEQVASIFGITPIGSEEDNSEEDNSEEDNSEEDNSEEDNSEEDSSEEDNSEEDDSEEDDSEEEEE